MWSIIHKPAAFLWLNKATFMGAPSGIFMSSVIIIAIIADFSVCLRIIGYMGIQMV